MDQHPFDILLRTLPQTRRSAFTMLLAGAGGLGGITTAGARKHKGKHKKKPCAKRCQDGCCTRKRGKCIRAAAQGSQRCGNHGEICRSTGCAGACPSCSCSASDPCPTGQCCSGNGTCGACLVFLTSHAYKGNVNGLDGADEKCQERAALAGWAGQFRAWLSDPTGSPSTRFTRATVSYILVDGTVVASDWSGLTSGSLQHAIDRTEKGVKVGSIHGVWTNTLANGTAENANDFGHCDSWHNDGNYLGNLGNATSTVGAWTNSATNLCSEFQQLYCFQQA